MSQFQAKPLMLDYESYKRNGKSIQNLTIDKYKVQKELGKGNFCSVYLAEDKEKRKVALKVIDLLDIRDESHPKVKEIRERLAISEPKLMMKCNSEHLLKCYDIYENKDLKILVMEYCQGKSLEDYLKKKKRLSEREAVVIMRQIISGIAELHAKNVIHRDLKTQNIMEHQGAYKIIDFGFSKEIKQGQMKHTLLGTPTTMAPEVKNKKNYGLKADIWSLGIIFLELIYGVQPYDSANADKFYKDIEKRFEVPEPQPLFGVTLSKEAHDFLKKVLKIDSTERMDWRQMIEHPFIKIRQQEPLPSRFLHRASLIEPEVDPRLKNDSIITDSVDITNNRLQPEKLEVKPEEKQELEPQEKRETQFKKKGSQKIQQKEQQKKKQKKEQQKTEERYNPRFSKPSRFERQKKLINQRQLLEEEEQLERKKAQKAIITEMRRSSQIFREMKQKQLEQEKNSEENYQRCLKMHLSCLKTELIFKQIFSPIEKQALLNFELRQTIQFSYLLLSRCFLNMSPLKQEMKENPHPHKAFFSLNEQIQSMYQQVKSKFQEYSKKLTDIENKKIEITKDFFSKIIWKQFNEEKNKFLGSGIEKTEEGKDFGDFSTKEQIIYTYTYIEKILPSLADLGEFTDKLKKLLQNYIAIQTVQLSELKDENFRQFTKRIIS